MSLLYIDCGDKSKITLKKSTDDIFWMVVLKCYKNMVKTICHY